MIRAIAYSVLLASSVFAQQPQVRNAKLQTASAAAGLDKAVQGAISGNSSPFWLGHAVQAVPGGGSSCCWNNGVGGCTLENNRGVTTGGAGGSNVVNLEGPSHLAVLMRIE